MSVFNSIMNGLFDVICFPLRGLPPLVGLIVISALSGVVLLLVFKYTSPQKTIGRVKNRIKANLYEIRLFKDDLGIISRAIGRLLKDNAVYIGCCSIALAPMLILVAPILFQLDARYGFEPLKEGDRVIVDVVLSEGFDPVESDVALELPEGLVLEAGPVRIPKDRELVYRVRVAAESEHSIGVAVDGNNYTKRVDALAGGSSISPSRFNSSMITDLLMFPSEEPWPSDAHIESINLGHARASMIGMPGDYYPWLWIFCIVGLAFGFAVKGIFKVNI